MGGSAGTHLAQHLKLISFTTTAARLLEADAQRYEAKRSGLGRMLMDEVAKVLVHIQAFPKAAQQMMRDVRQFPVNRFPFWVIYRERESDVQVILVAPMKADPRAVNAIIELHS